MRSNAAGQALKSLEAPTIRQRWQTFRDGVIARANVELDPIRKKRWRTDVLLPIRNRMLGYKPISIKVDGTSIKLAPVGAMATSLWNQPRAEIYPLKLLLRFLQPGQAFFDAGADAGLYAIAVAKSIGQSRVYAFEPSEERFQLLRQNTSLNGLKHLHTVQTALIHHLGERVPQSDFPSVPAQQGTAPATTLDDFIESNAIPDVDVMRVSVGGAELPVLQGARKLLDRSDAPLVLYEASSEKTSRLGYHPVEILWFLADCGYRFSVMDAQGRITPRQPNAQYDGVILAAKSNHLPRLNLLGSSL